MREIRELQYELREMEVDIRGEGDATEPQPLEPAALEPAELLEPLEPEG